MIERLPAVLLGLAGIAAGAIAHVSQANSQTPNRQELTRIPIVYIGIENDSRHEPIVGYARLIIKERSRPVSGAQTGLLEAQSVERVANITFALRKVFVASDGDLPGRIDSLRRSGIRYFLLDAPDHAFAAIAQAVKGQDLLIFNISETSDALRRHLCARQFVHVIPSRSMLSDALVQHLVSRKWRRILVLEGPANADRDEAESFARSARKFGATVVTRKKFRAGNDPRNREANNPALITAVGSDYDVIYIADGAFEFARTLEYRTARARPVVGSIGLVSAAWDWSWERHGAPQVNNRFRKQSKGRRMQDADWAAWMSIKMISQAVLRAGAGDFSAQRKYILGNNGFDGAKGAPASVRPWDQQLRQSILLATANAVVATAPLPGFLHQFNRLDTLGDDRRDSPCRLDGPGT